MAPQPSPIMNAGLLRLACKSGAASHKKAFDFCGKFCALQQIGEAIRINALPVDTETVDVIAAALLDRSYARQRQAYFYYQAAANTLRSIVDVSKAGDAGERALQILRQALSCDEPALQRAVSDVISQLPTPVTGPHPAGLEPAETPDIHWRKLTRKFGLDLSPQLRIFGRSLVVAIRRPHHGKLLVIKLARAKDSVQALAREAAWMVFLGQKPFNSDLSFRVPAVIRIGRATVFRIAGLPRRPRAVDPENHAVVFIADRDYFAYPNHPRPHSQYDPGRFRAVILQNARLLGKLASMGIVHTAPIPLFHNRIQVRRRNDEGLYQWHRGGRLDRWLSSCAFPNLGPTGLRDFEHFTSIRGSNRGLYRYVGNHLLSLLLVAASYFRNREPSLIGHDIQGRAVDARQLFDPGLFKDMLHGIFTTYYEGFTARAFSGPFPFELKHLVARMIEEMGVDRHMEEVLRVADQSAMDLATFQRLLLEGGFGRDQIKGMQPGREDIVIHSGPHLGAFNGTISLPELISAIGSMAALCMLGRFRQQSRT